MGRAAHVADHADSSERHVVSYRARSHLVSRVDGGLVILAREIRGTVGRRGWRASSDLTEQASQTSALRSTCDE